MIDAQSAPRLRPIDAPVLDELLEPATHARLAAELPSFARDGAAVRDAFRDTGLLGTERAVWVVERDGARWVVELWSPDAPRVATTLRIGVVALDAASDPPLEAVLAHVWRTTTAVRVERAVDPDDTAARAVCERAGLALESIRRRAALRHGRPADVALYTAIRHNR